MKIVEKLNEYFGTECENVEQFLEDFLESPDEQLHDLHNFLFWLERKELNKNQF